MLVEGICFWPLSLAAFGVKLLNRPLHPAAAPLFATP